MDKRTLSDNMKTLENLIWKYASFSLNNRTIGHSVITTSTAEAGAWALELTGNTTTKPIDELIKKLEKASTIDFEIYRPTPRKIYVAPTTTADEKYFLLELKAYTVGQEVLEAQKKVLEAKQRWIQPMKDLAEAKKARKTA
jgi:hypothetical protein